jgi:glycosyltransferase involved in cell wall biosynthesis
MNEKTIAIILPAYNEADRISDVISNISISSPTRHSIIVVNDGSNDKTSLYAKKSRAIVINHNRNKGYGGALRTGIRRAIDDKFDFMVLIDADGQHDASQINRILEPLLKDEADFTIGSRFLEPVDLPFPKKWSIPLLNNIISFITGIKISDTQSGFRGFTLEVARNFTLKEDGMGASLEILFDAIASKSKIIEVPISCIYDEYSNKLSYSEHLYQLLSALYRVIIDFYLKSNKQ